MTINLHKVDDHLWRSGQPYTDADWQEIASLGVRRVLKMNVEESDDLALRHGLSVEPLLMADGDGQRIGGARIDLFERGDALLCEPGPWLVHCHEGKDRAGMVVARYRVLRCGWSKQAAYDEWLRMGFHGYAGLLHAWKEWVPSCAA